MLTCIHTVVDNQDLRSILRPSGGCFVLVVFSRLVFADLRLLVRRASVTSIGRNRRHGRITETSGRGRHVCNRIPFQVKK